MNPREQEERETWESWLDEVHGEKLIGIREAVRNIYDQNQQQYGPLPYFTPHGPKHCEAVEDLIHKVIPGRRHEQLTIKEKFYLLAGAWLHDIGMLQLVAISVYGRLLDEHEVRKRHHVTSEKYIVGHWGDLHVDEDDREILGKLCRYHRRIEDINSSDCKDRFLVKGSWSRLRLLAAYLRLADSLDIGSSRTPAEPYAVCLAYDIPEDSKLYWIKSRLINGVFPDPDDRTITVQFKYPEQSQLDAIAQKSASEKVNAVIDLVLDDLQDELRSVMNVITRTGISYYLDVVRADVTQSFDSRMVNDLRELVINFDIVTAPSASKLLEMILVSTANIIGFSLNKDAGPSPFPEVQEGNIRNLRIRVSDFLGTVEKKIMSTRPHHLGLRNLVEECKTYVQELTDNESVALVAGKINDRYTQHLNARHAVRDNARKFFSEVLPGCAVQTQINVLVYGYSELVTKAICGLRDYLIVRQYPGTDPGDVYNRKEERLVSKRIRVFVCEGQPKTQTGYNDRLIYHDGSQYALHLSERGFTNVNVIPDIIACTIMAQIPIDYIFLGANGLTNDYFMHAAGHAAIVELARNHRGQAKESPSGKVVTILVASKEKVLVTPEEEQCDTIGNTEGIDEIEGYLFRRLPKCAGNRRNIWICRDKQLLESLGRRRVCLINPREDRIPINRIDYIVSDVGYRTITEANANSVISNLFS